jgi:hypothetical protein
MRLNFKGAFDALLRFGKHPHDSDLPVSMVLLLGESDFLTLEQLRSSAERAFRMPFSASKASIKNPNVADSQYCVIQAVFFTLMKVGPHTLSFLNYTKPYGEDDLGRDFGESLPLESQRRAWFQHKAWTAVDYSKRGTDPERRYAVLARLCTEMVNRNCLGVYLPRERRLIPNDGSLLQELHRIASVGDRGAAQAVN